MFDREGNPVRKKLSDKCHLCEWDGEPGELFLSSDQYHRQDLETEEGRVERKELQTQASRCLSCEARLLFLEQVTRYEGASPEATDELSTKDYHGGRIYYSFLLQGHSEPRFRNYDFFIPVENSLPPDDGRFWFPRRRAIWDSTTEDSMKRSLLWAQESIKDCLHEHKLCVEQGDDSVIPTRLIDVNPGGMGLDVKLRESNDLPPGDSHSYAALSYCWGFYKPKCMTTNATYEENLRRITWDSLPNTFRDAVEFTRGLGLKYLWIDSVCIIQGDEKDWQREAGRMFDVYKGSKVTLAAVFGDDSTSGLRNTTMRQQTRIAANLKFGESICPIYFRRHHYLWEQLSGSNAQQMNTNIPLLTRAWAYQGRIISPRVLFFTESEVVYQCACNVKCECGSATDGSKHRRERSCDKTRISLATHLNVGQKTGESKNPSIDGGEAQHILEIQATWRQIVIEDYSLMNMTNRRDKLVALGAIAAQFQRVRPNSKYLAGTWSDSLLEDLMWYCAGPRPLPQGPSQDKKELDQALNLPSWSWASVETIIFYLGCEPTVDTNLAEIMESECVWAEDNPFGIIKRSTLILRSMMLSCTLKNDGKVYEPEDLVTSLVLELSMDYYDTECCPDEPDAQEVHLLQLKEKKDTWSDEWIQCLMLRLKDRNAKIYSRCGVVTYYKRSKTERAFKERGKIVECEIR